MDFGRYLAIAITVVAFMFVLWILLQTLGVVTTSLNQATNQIVTTVSTATATAPKVIYAFQPTNPSISSSNAQGYLAQLPQCSISSNPYGGAAGTYGLLNCVAIKYGAISAVVWFYEPQGGMGVLLSFQTSQYPSSSPIHWSSWLYVGTNGLLYGNDWSGSYLGVSTSSAISPGWHMAVIEEYYSSGTYYIALYLDGKYIGQSSTSNLPQLFGGGGSYPYNDIGTGYAKSWPNTNGGWFFFSGAIAYVAIYNTVLSQSQIQTLYQTEFPNELFSQNLVVAYVLVPGYYNGGGYYFIPYFVNSQIMSQMGISNADATSITPSGSTGAIPSSQFIPLSYPYFTIISGNGVAYTINNATGMDASALFSPAINYAQGFASGFALVTLIGLVVAFIWTRRR